MSKKFNNIEINSLVKKIQQGDELATLRFFKIFKSYIEGIVRKYSMKTNIKDDNDLRSYIRIGFYKAALYFNENMNTQFKNYAFFWVKKLIFSEEQKFRIIKLPINQKIFYDNMITTINDANGDYVTNISASDRRQMDIITSTEVHVFSDFVYTSSSSCNDSSSIMYSEDHEAYKINKSSTTDNDMEKKADYEKLNYNINVMLANFSSLEKEIIEYTYGLNDRPEMHTHALAVKLNISDSTLLSKKNKLIRMMRHSSLTDHLFK